MNQNGVICLPGPALLFFVFRFEYLISGPKSYGTFEKRALVRLASSAEVIFIPVLHEPG